MSRPGCRSATGVGSSGFGFSFSIFFSSGGGCGRCGKRQLHRRFPSPVGRRGFIAAFHRTSASIAPFLSHGEVASSRLTNRRRSRTSGFCALPRPRQSVQKAAPRSLSWFLRRATRRCRLIPRIPEPQISQAHGRVPSPEHSHDPKRRRRRHSCLSNAFDDYPLEILASRISIGLMRVTEVLFAIICPSNDSISSKYAKCSFLFGRNGAV